MNYIKELRIKMNLTQIAFAIRLGVHVATVKQWEMGMQPNEENKDKIKRLCILHNVGVE